MQTRLVGACGVMRSAIDALAAKTKSIHFALRRPSIPRSQSRLLVTGALAREVQK